MLRTGTSDVSRSSEGGTAERRGFGALVLVDAGFFSPIHPFRTTLAYSYDILSIEAKEGLADAHPLLPAKTPGSGPLSLVSAALSSTLSFLTALSQLRTH